MLHYKLHLQFSLIIVFLKICNKYILDMETYQNFRVHYQNAVVGVIFF